MSKNIVISGYYGFGNTGDEAVLCGILEAFQQVNLEAKVTVLSANPAQTKILNPSVNAVHRYKPLDVIKAISKANLVISGGGSLFQDVTSTRSLKYYLFILKLAQAFGKKTMVYAQGIGPLVRPTTIDAVKKTLNKVNAITVRDRDSKQLLENIGVNKTEIILSADPTFLINPDYKEADDFIKQNGLEGKEILGVSLRDWKDKEKWLDSVYDGIKTAASELNMEIVFIPMQMSEDKEVCTSAGIGQLFESSNPRAIKGMICKCKIVFGMRLHSLIFAASGAIPFSALAYDPKVVSFAELSEQKTLIKIDEVTKEKTLASIKQCYMEHSINLTHLNELSKKQNQNALISAEVAKNLISL